ncbi:MAG: DUF389 domain-containing protein [Anaerolineae bacterium]|nr:MAG: DUF389 domain-containing protein [Anaerolineae bacterium]
MTLPEEPSSPEPPSPEVPENGSTSPAVAPEMPPPTSRRATRARRRRARRLLAPPDAQGRAAVLARLSHRAYPSYEFFVFAFLCGGILGAGYILDSQALLIFGALTAPLMTPWMGMTLATSIGAARFFFQTLAALLIGGALVFITGLLAGMAARIWMPLTLNQTYVHSRLWWPDLFVLALGAILLVVSFVRSEEKPYLPSVMLAYELFLPLSAGGFGLGGGLGEVWPHGLWVFVTHLAWATFFGTLTLFALRFYPRSWDGMFFGGLVLLILLFTLVELTGLRTAAMVRLGWITPAPTPEAAQVPAASPPAPSPPPIPSLTPTTLPIPTPTATASKTATPSPSPAALTNLTLPPTATATETITPHPTPVYARIKAAYGGGATLRKEPEGIAVAVLDNGELVEILPEREEINGQVWIHVVALRDDQEIEGWIIQDVLVTATPVPNWRPSATPSVTSSPLPSSTP